MKYLFFDIDGTLVTHEQGLVPSAKKAIDTARAKGHKVFLSTGRHLHALAAVKDLEVDGILYCNGAGIYYNGEIVATYPIPHDICSRTVFQAEEREGAYSLLSSYVTFKNIKEEERLVKILPLDSRYSSVEEKMAALGAKPFTEFRYEDILKIDIGFDTEAIMDDFLKEMHPELQLASTAGYHVEEGKRSGEITAKGINKGTSIQKFIAMVGGKMEDTYGFGDSSNDLEMLQVCHTGVAMGNAFEEVKKCADFITKTANEDGIAYALQELGLL